MNRRVGRPRSLSRSGAMRCECNVAAPRCDAADAGRPRIVRRGDPAAGPRWTADLDLGPGSTLTEPGPSISGWMGVG